MRNRYRLIEEISEPDIRPRLYFHRYRTRPLAQMIEPPPPEDVESSVEPSRDDREEGLGRRILYAIALVLGKLALGMLFPIVLVIILAFIAQRIIGH
jgi:hypothetical protein